jgi:rod shape-determining protein MreD
MRNLALIGFGFALLILQAVLSTLIPLHTFAPNLMLPITIFLGVYHEVPIVRGALIAFVLGYLLDAFCGSPMGLHTFVLVAVFMVARGAGLRLFLRGPLFQISLTFMMSLLAGGTVVALRAIFEKLAPFPTADYRNTALILVQSSLVTALSAPPIFMAIRKIEGLPAQRSDEGSTAT